MNIPAVFQPGWKWCGIALLLGALLGAWATWWVTNKTHTADIATLKQQHSEDLKSISDVAAKQASDTLQKQQTFAKALSASDQKNTQELNDALAKNQALRDDIATGSKRLQFANAKLATCEQSADAAKRAASMVNAATVELSPEAGRNILDIRAGIISDQQKLKALQDYIRAGQDAGVIAK
ncbi:lysis protein [Escherichia coli]|uniref:lysis protein n=1 Tax=Escherichia coli TaxID=562 RepID=UPI001F0556D4|nr:lysis protein [Escherichia coli]MCH0685592.1 lysis protein [Escherichia coli]MDZ8667093.1 lysis protein [Escherichia coli]WRX87675.1 lysis protein [Escherichia coli]